VQENLEDTDEEENLEDAEAGVRERGSTYGILSSHVHHTSDNRRYSSTTLVFGGDSSRRPSRRRDQQPHQQQQEEIRAEDIDQFIQQERENYERAQRQRQQQRRNRARQAQRDARIEREERERLFMAGSIAFLRQFESQIPSLETQTQSLLQSSLEPRLEQDEEEKALDHQPILRSRSISEELASENLLTQTAYELDEQDELQELYETTVDELREEALRFRARSRAQS